ncbi:23S rRNA (pseudouridine(1915)-N(3))-methyltransferase RlmH [uncultured Pseudoflavonifractor sp.]|uniref:23S rRNA (pseudouridine(1915)-N(3))-methyltransferase RlmH n=1 Tax=uncultured Pseudoflavonifractor sp. TaxID=1221379 RepID=UPI0025EB7E5E|nr:23S rRNA (pseudouridine(1915)-N(3))-methyltransferase RlmH [uncultured Pseudoflavonifractor sp.]
MLGIHVICVGKLKEKFYTEASAEYAKRLGGYCKFRLIELPEERLPDSPSQAQIDAALGKEADAIFQRLPRGAAVTAMCVEGKGLSSEELSRRITDWAGQGRSQLCFVIGSSYGLHPSVKERADLRLSMSKMTFPHHLARVMLLEQIYRAFKIAEGSSYHK